MHDIKITFFILLAFINYLQYLKKEQSYTPIPSLFLLHVRIQDNLYL
jgi:hypothetical protein